MKKRTLLTIAAITAFMLPCVQSAGSTPAGDTLDAQVFNQAKELAGRMIIVDCHSHNLFHPESKKRQKQVTLPLVKAGGVKGIIQQFPLDWGEVKNPEEDILNAVRRTKKRILAESLRVSIALQSRDLLSAGGDAPPALVFGLEYFGGLFGGRVEMAKDYYNEGVRETGLVEIGGADTLFADGCITPFGQRLLKELNHLGLLCDITHMDDDAKLRFIEASSAPLMVSHANPYAVVKSEFNVTDTVLKRLVARGGIVCVTFTAEQVSETANGEVKRMRAGGAIDLKKIPPTSIGELINHIDYLKRTVGIENIGIGSDYGGSGWYAPEGLKTIEGFPLILYHLLKRGYTPGEIEKVMGMNFVHYFERVEANAAALRR